MTKAKRLHAHTGDYKGWATVAPFLPVGTVGILVCVAPERQAPRWELWRDAPLTNLSFERRENGWCGSTNGVSITAYGRKKMVERKVIQTDFWTGAAIFTIAKLEDAEGEAELLTYDEFDALDRAYLDRFPEIE